MPKKIRRLVTGIWSGSIRHSTLRRDDAGKEL